jgi:hypothetical protein
MVGESGGHRWSTRLPFAAMLSGVGEFNFQSTVRPHKIEDRVFEIDLALQELFLFGMRQGFADQSAIALTGRQVITFHIGGVDLSAAPVGLQDTHNVGFRAKYDAATDFDDTATFALFIDLPVTELGVDYTLGLLAWTPRPTFRWWRLRRTVVRDQSDQISWQFVTGKQGRATVGSRLKISQKRGRFTFTSLMAEMTYHTKATGKGHGAPNPHVTLIG